jgi:HYR domain
VVLTIGAAALVAVAAATADPSTQTGSLAMGAPLAVQSVPTNCPPDAPPTANLCANRTGNGLVPGLGRVTGTYWFFEEDCVGAHRVLETTARLEIQGKGALQVALARGDQCVPSGLIANRTFRITGGSGLYAGASGGGTLVHNLHYTTNGAEGNDTWTGTLTVPGLEFDVAPPTISGAGSKTVRAPKRAKRMRVTYRVTASDAVDGAVTVACAPRSGTSFKVGRTTVKCTASDSSGNVKTARFTVTVKRRR